MNLDVVRRGSGEALLLLHGFTTGGRAWEYHADALSQQFRVVMPDLPGHGSSPAPADVAAYGMAACVGDLVAVLDRLAIERTHCLGYSMGGRVALALALAHPERIRSLVLESASPGIADTGERRQRRERDEALAARIESDGVAAFVDDWMAQPLFASQRALPEVTRAAARRLRLENSARGLANSLRGLGTGAQPSFWADLPDLRVPTLLIAGEQDEKFRGIAARMATAIPAARVTIIADAGHTTHLEQPAAFLHTVTSFLTAVTIPMTQRSAAPQLAAQWATDEHR